MEKGTEQSFEELVKAGTLLSSELNFKARISILVEQSLDITRATGACLYLRSIPDDASSDFRLSYRRGRISAPLRLLANAEWVEFIAESEEAVVILSRKPSPFVGILLEKKMESGIAFPLNTNRGLIGILVLNDRQPNFFTRDKFNFLESFSKMAAGMLQNARLHEELKEYLAKIEAMERYQENIFSSMTNLLVTTDKQGRIKYFNEAAKDSLDLSDGQLGMDFRDVWKKTVDKKIIQAFDEVGAGGNELLGIEGIYKREKGEIDFSVNATPLMVAGGRKDGMTLVFTDQTKEKELQGEVVHVVEERRVIKDMFSRYLSNDIMQTLMDSPEMIKPGGEKKDATVLFADIRGYTTFSEGRDPSQIIKILNEYFSEAVDIVIKSGGYIDKFIGDAIMAAWGVPLTTDEDETFNAVYAALKIQKLIGSSDRTFFKGSASGLRVGIGMHTGPLVAGNLGSAQRMDYTVIGDTVNVAARLEGVAGPGEVIITQNTRDHLGDRFVLESRDPVTVKGKSQPIPIFAVIDLAG